MKKYLVLLALAAPLAAQTEYRKHYITAGGGAGMPYGELSSSLSSSPVLRIGYGYRFDEHFQADIGLDTVFHAAKVKDFFPSVVGDLRIRDYQYLMPLGGRAIVPLSRGRLLLSGGGGAAYLRYQESIRQPFGEALVRLECYVCRSRSGWGYYGLLGASVALDRYQNFRLGFTTRLYRANTEGDAFGTLPALETKDTWLNTAAEFSVSF